MQCPKCAKFLKLSDISEYQVKGTQRHIQCYHCQTWLKNSGVTLMLKVIAFYVCAISIGVGYFMAEWRTITTPIAIMALIATLVSHLMDQWAETEAPKNYQSKSSSE
ncbi:hypothetical protein [Paraferrimonas haliotis]|uniref:Cxxc_20_cxxc protein n=1 Tax=Paraferrimonas haliotis TaxID=2013866 RepID=A0AA37TPZ8_9GAMM|nr:hypothetical protein [Paraferrimonas haliotis]GLS82411.1 hypothetical protein GCM10007894_03880 [Paraferrimonas haliotis]